MPGPDPAFSVVDVGLGGVEGPPLVLAVDETGELIVVVRSDRALWSVRCSDQDCGEPRTEMVLADVAGTKVEAAIRGDGAIVIVVEEGDSGVRTIQICNEVDRGGCADPVDLVDDEPCVSADGSACGPAAGVMSLALGSGGVPAVAYYTGGQSLRLAVCVDMACSVYSTATVLDQEEGPWWYGPLELHAGPDGAFFIDRSREMFTEDRQVTEATVVACADALCTDPTIATFDGATGRSSHHGSDGFLFWTQTGAVFNPPEYGRLGVDDLVAAVREARDVRVARCTFEGCGDARPVPVGEDWLLPGVENVAFLATAGSGTAVVHNHFIATAPAFGLKLSYCETSVCEAGDTIALGIEDVWVGAGMFAVTDLADGRLRIAYPDSAGSLLLIACHNQTCTPPP